MFSDTAACTRRSNRLHISCRDRAGETRNNIGTFAHSDGTKVGVFFMYFVDEILQLRYLGCRDRVFFHLYSMSWRVRALVGDKKRTCKVVHSTTVREPVGCFELLIDVDKTPAQPVSGKQHLRFLHEIARSSGCCCTYNISCLGIPKLCWRDTTRTRR